MIIIIKIIHGGSNGCGSQIKFITFKTKAVLTKTLIENLEGAQVSFSPLGTLPPIIESKFKGEMINTFASIERWQAERLYLCTKSNI